MIIRNALNNDLKAIVNIYNATIPSRLATADLEPVSIESKLTWFNERSTKRPIWVAELDNKVVGWLSFTDFFNRRPAYDRTAELSIYISSEYKYQGIGKTLISRAIDYAYKEEIHTLLGFIFAHNKPSLNIFSKYGFNQWGYLPNVANLDNIERDLVIMGRHIITPADD